MSVINVFFFFFINFNYYLKKRKYLIFFFLALRKNDVLFLLKVSSNQKIGAKFDAQKSFKSLFDIVVVRGCEVEGFLGPDGRVIDEIGLSIYHL